MEHLPDRHPVAYRAGRDRDVHPVIEDDQAEDVFGMEPADQAVDRLQRGRQLAATHRSAAVQHHLQAGRVPAPVPLQPRCRYLEQQVYRLSLIDGDYVEVQLCV